MSRLKVAGKFGAGVCAVSVIIAILGERFGDQIRTSPHALEIIGNAEGCRRDPYKCPANVLTVGIGSTAFSGEPIEPHKRYTDIEIAERWVNDIQIAERCVNRYADGYNIPQSVFDASVSLTFNVGCSAVRKSTMFNKIRQGNYSEACNELSKWVYAGGRRLPGLVIRREKERQLCLTGLANH